MKLHPAIKNLHQRVVRIQFVARAGQEIAAFETHSVLVFEQALATGGANARIEQVEDAIEPFAEFHGVLMSEVDVFLPGHHGLGFGVLGGLVEFEHVVIDGEIQRVGEELVGAALLPQHFVVHAAIAG